VGPYAILRAVADGPGASWLEAEDPDGERRLLQVVRLRAAADEGERALRQKHEKQIAQRTAEIIHEADVTIHAHGGSDFDEGERVLFWALPWTGAPFLLERALERPLSLGEILRVGSLLAARMSMRHTWGRVEPLLVEHAIRVADAGKIELAGAPIAVSRTWLSESMAAPRLAPEELESEERKPSGDVWRLGKLLMALGDHAEPVTDDVRALFFQLAEDDRDKRIVSASKAVELFERISRARSPSGIGRDPAVFAGLLSTHQKNARPGLSEEPTITVSTPSEQAMRVLAAAADAISSASNRSTPAILGPPDLVFEPEAVTKKSEPETPVPEQGGVIIVDRTDEAMEKANGKPHVSSSVPTLVPQSVPDTIVEPTHAPDAQEAVLRVIADPVPTERIEPHTPDSPTGVPVLIARDTPILSMPSLSAIAPEVTLRDGALARTDPEMTILDGRARPANGSSNGAHGPNGANGSNGHGKSGRDPIAAVAWQQPLLPQGESPWSEVVIPRGTHTRARSEFPGFSGEIGSLIRVDPRPSPPAPLPSFTRSTSYDDVPTAEMEAEIAAALRGFNARKVVSAVLALLVMAGFFALLSRTGSSPRGANETLMVTQANEVALDSDPPGASIISEGDGALLGQAPLKFLVAPGAQPFVFVFLPGHEPLRLSLPERGGITAKLTRMDDTPCAITLSTSERAEIEGVTSDIGSGVERTIPGAAIVRAKAGGRLKGARLVACPQLGGSKEQVLHFDRRTGSRTVKVTQPHGAAAYINGDPIGAVPASGDTEAAFSRIQVGDPQGNTEERFVATLSPIEVRMPAPKQRPVPVVLAPDSGEEERLKIDLTGDDPGPAKEESAPYDPNAKLSKAERVIRARHLLKTGIKALSQGRAQKARETLSECVDLDPQAAECHKNLGMLYRRSRLAHKAREHFTKYLELAPTAADADKIKKMME
jgi:hypothetical protein